MKIIVITPGALPFPPINGGAVENLISLYIENNEKKHQNDYVVISRYVNGIKKYKNKYQHTKLIYINTDTLLFKVKKMFRYFLRHILKLKTGNAYEKAVLKEIKHIDFDAIIVENEPAFIYELRKKYPDKIIYLHLHNDSLRAYKKDAKDIINKYDKIMPVSNYLKNKIIEIDPTANVETLYNAVNINRFNNKLSLEDVKKVKEKYNIPDNKKIVMFVGRLQKEKGILELVKAFNNANKGNWHLVIVGASFFKNSKKDQFTEKIEKLINDSQNNISLTGYVDYEDIHLIYSTANIGVVPSLCNEAFGMTLLEFMASGIPTIITNDGALPEIATNETSIIIDRNNNILEDLENALTKLLNENNNIKQIKEKSIERAKKFDIIHYVKTFNEIIGDKNE